ncbi:MAG: 4-hydroxy-3-methylbut-2-enyl diphosphate reductase [Bacteroidales bacterium]|nr:4-hydroxy-3-methylbut-2-enyl diphosphate reductase [Candidatus Minthousia equi]
MKDIEIDQSSGFCFGVTTAISKVEEELTKNHKLYCLGDIVHNGQECERLRLLGLDTIDHEAFSKLHDVRVLFRAHGEPPQTYQQAQRNNIQLIDATCPVVLRLQQRIKVVYDQLSNDKQQIVIFGKNGHAEVLGLVGQTEGKAIVIETPEEVEKLDFNNDIYLFSQTTKSLDGFRKVVNYIQQHISPTASFKYFDTICRQVANRMPNICQFASKHDLVLFVCGKKSSNGKVLYNECKKVNPNTYLVDSPQEIKKEWIEKAETIGICGATSTPKWLMEQCRDYANKIQE